MKIVLIEPLGVVQEKLEGLSKFIEDGGHEFIQYHDRREETEVLIERARDADVVILTNLPFRESVLRECKNLKMISVAFTGVDHVDMDYCKNNNILVSNCAGYSTDAVAELAYGLMLGLYRRIVTCDKVTRVAGTKAGLIGFELAGKKLGIIGTGAIGEKVIEIGMAFGCDVLAYSRTEKEHLKEKGVRYMSLEEVMSKSDIVSLHLPLNENTKGMISKKHFDMMKPDAIFINTARGPIIDNTALAKALKEEKIAGAGIDVFEVEPPIPSNYPLFDTPNTIVTPHVAFATKEALVKRAIICFDNIESWMKGQPQNIM
ncbi:2-hydroxyacid dehydrogenase [Vallitalea longa]|uniref:2-hydroxyacid dehydrogenase n=1 Tax=Vallitalea longa TaxID=2936439 RepID=A0A9W6DD93_9FIRM|nr:2-hydroxyacid dehydrogenase [Vallitalea longa]GKX27750.1 2-hydroxyacid dehydrogenase [Vallitalea longa]